jgi:hypothetical protein
MRTVVWWYLIPFVAGLVILQVIGSRFERAQWTLPLRLAGGSSQTAPDSGGTDPTVTRAVAAGRLWQAQDQYLHRLLTTPGDEGAMRRLVAVRRRLAGDNALALLRQSSAFQEAIAFGKETAEQYSKDSMKILALADTRAAAEIVAEEPHNAGRWPVRVAPGTSRNAPSAAGVSVPRASSASTDSHKVQSGTPPVGDSSTSTTAEVKASSTAPQAAPDPRQTAFTVPVHSSDLPIVSNRGELFGLDCAQRAFTLHTSNGDEQYFASPNIVIYVRGSQSEKLPAFCALQRFLGHTVLVWSTIDGHRNISTALSVLMPTPQ